MVLPFYVIWVSTSRQKYLKFWTLFGASNQLLAALTSVVDHRLAPSSPPPYRFTLIPMIFVLIITLWALVTSPSETSKPLVVWTYK